MRSLILERVKLQAEVSASNMMCGVAWIVFLDHLFGYSHPFFISHPLKIDSIFLGMSFHLIAYDILCNLKEIPYFNYVILQCQEFLLTSLMDPCPQIVMDGNATSDTGLPVVRRVVVVGSACQSS